MIAPFASRLSSMSVWNAIAVTWNVRVASQTLLPVAVAEPSVCSKYSTLIWRLPGRLMPFQ